MPKTSTKKRQRESDDLYKKTATSAKRTKSKAPRKAVASKEGPNFWELVFKCALEVGDAIENRELVVEVRNGTPVLHAPNGSSRVMLPNAKAKAKVGTVEEKFEFLVNNTPMLKENQDGVKSFVSVQEQSIQRSIKTTLDILYRRQP